MWKLSGSNLYRAVSELSRFTVQIHGYDCMYEAIDTCKLLLRSYCIGGFVGSLQIPSEDKLFYCLLGIQALWC